MATLEEAAPQATARPLRKSRRWGRTLLLTLLALLLVLLIAVAGLVFTKVYRPLPATNGTATLPGLSGAVTVVCDKSGIPHISAANQHDLFRAQGYVMAQDRLWQMDFFRRVGEGRLSEVLGDSTVETDRFLRTIGLNRAAAREAAALTDPFKTVLQDYADGVNAYISSHSDGLPIEFTILGYKPAPWTITDTVAFGKYMAWDLAENYSVEIAMADLQAKLGPERAALLLPAYPDGKTTIVPQSALPGNPNGTPLTRRYGGIFGANGVDATVGSNNWVVDGTRTADGHPLLANDPHLSVQNPAIWYAMHLRADDGSFEAAGVTFPGAPGIVIGHNNNIAWGVTNLGPDTQDLFVERLDPAAHPGQYEYQGQWLPLEVVTETIKVKGAADVLLPVRLTRHGPLVNGVMDGVTTPTAFQWTADAPGALLPSVYAVDLATDWASFHAALAGWDVAGQNFVYADTKGNIGYQATGRWPIRKAGNGLVPAEGWTGANEWTGFVPYEEMPRVYNPPQHMLVSANNRVVPPDYPYLVNGYWFSWFRAERISTMLAAKDMLTASDFAAIHYDTHNPVALRLGERAAALTSTDARTSQALTLFKGWDGDLKASSPAAALYELTFQHLMTDTFADDLGAELTEEYRGMSDAAVVVRYNLLDDPQNPWWDDVNTPKQETRDDILLKSVAEAAADLTVRQGQDMSKWSWGQLHTITFNHPLGAVKPLDSLLNFGPFPMPGDGQTVAAAGYNSAYSQRSHPSMRMITNPGAWDQMQLIYSPGQSGQPGSPHWGDLVQDYLAGRYHTVPWSPAAVGAATEGTLTLRP